MNIPTPEPIRAFARRAAAALWSRFSLRDDHADDADIDSSLRAGVAMYGTNLWVLMFAIFIASIGLNVNSTAVIIGAMLISPLMGPIMGVGYGVGILDLALIRNALRHLGIATLIGLLTSTAYFALSPLRTVTPELLARTSPSIWDVMIALFGGLAGIIGVTRRQPSNVIPGVAIATALMPPLCTAGYGIATATWSIALGASYLFTINCVFIAASSALVIRAFRVKRKQFVDARAERRVRVSLAAVVIITLVPSLYLAYRLVGEEVFRTRATQFVRERLELPGTHVNNVIIDAKERRIEVSLLGAVVAQNVLAEVTSHLSGAGLEGATLQVYQTGDQHVDVATLKASVVGDLYRQSQAALADNARALRQVEKERDELRASSERLKDIPAEVHALYPSFDSLLVSEATEWEAVKGFGDGHTVVVVVRSRKPVGRADREKLEQWLRTRTKAEHARVVIDVK